ncbi:site-specific integrase [Marinobacter nanhaiticus D15-8W]|uniref:DUF3596 domain-containing protein n=1 Tax=Marinobacter nanhaiticus D15-8W TaxID=626887 RepID=N6W310_9GAMM|nr:site-specific integrase [Marinobacter nanhaiticus]ENO16930.1 DUF3596 domain-containing protein [Marinobacter nanhaiticus D15-8W]BES72223.1 site-specific integrase [Marinobacter nanhaiticus D15-8W]
MGRKGLGSLEDEIRKHPGVEIHGKTLRIWFMYQGQRCRETLGVDITKANIKQAAHKRAAILHDIKLGAFDYGRYFPNSPRARASEVSRSIKLSDLKERYWNIKVADITPGTERRYDVALRKCVEIVGEDLYTDTLMPEDGDRLRSKLIATRRPSTANNYMATWNGLAEWGKKNGYLKCDLSVAFFDKAGQEPDPLTIDEFKTVINKGCLHPQDVALVTLAVYSGIRPGELCALAREDVDGNLLHIRRSITDKGELKVTKTGQERTVILMPPARKAVESLLELCKDQEAREEAVAINRHESRLETLTPLVVPLQARHVAIKNRRLMPQSWTTKWMKLVARAGIRYRRVYQTRHTFACWSLTAHGNIAFIANQLGHKDYSMLVKVYGRWMPSESENEAEFVWSQMKKAGAFAPLMPQESEEE